MGKKDNEGLAKLLIIIGGLIGLFIGITGLIGGASAVLVGGGMGIIYGIIVILISIAILLSVLRPGDPIPMNLVVELIFGILLIIFGGLWLGLIAGILVIIGGILIR
ncbi:MAG: hypothetical protein ACP6IY_10365 [Promethearchaeia archaeon]